MTKYLGEQQKTVKYQNQKSHRHLKSVIELIKSVKVLGRYLLD